MKTKEIVHVQKSSAASLVLAILAMIMSAAALAVGITALVRSCADSAAKRVTAAEYNYIRPDGEDDEEENIGSDTLAF
ncbi:MAG: hypothetical protein NC395_02640 [Prevotella sp.]|nr:hypothetical protein [Prevotella sp.]